MLILKFLLQYCQKKKESWYFLLQVLGRMKEEIFLALSGLLRVCLYFYLFFSLLWEVLSLQFMAVYKYFLAFVLHALLNILVKG